MPEKSPTSRRNADLDGLRGLAALAVALGHCYLETTGLPLWATSLKDFPHMAATEILARIGAALFPSDLAVTVFFVLSGHVLWQSFSRKHMRFWRDLPDYVAARCYRLLPLTIVTGMILGWLSPYSGAEVIDNMLLFSHSLNGVLWSLQVEMICSAVLFLLWGLTRGQPWKLGLCLLISLLLLVPYHTTPSVLFMPAFILGAGIDLVPKAIWRRKPLLIAACLVLVFANVFLGHGGPERCAEMAAATMLVGAAGQGEIPFLRDRVPHFLGMVSYPFYLTHILGLALTRPIVHAIDLSSQAASFVALAVLSIPPTIVLAWLLHVLIEAPVQRAKPDLRWPARLAWPYSRRTARRA